MILKYKLPEQAFRKFFHLQNLFALHLAAALFDAADCLNQAAPETSFFQACNAGNGCTAR
jgi:hypothetical protein